MSRGRTAIIMTRDTSLLDPFTGYVSVEIEGRTFQLPDSNTVLRLLQYLGIDLYNCRLCWNGECDNCHVSYIDPDTRAERTGRSCELMVSEGLRILRIPHLATWPIED